MVKIEIRKENIGAFFDLTGDVTIGLTKEDYKNMDLFDAKVVGINGYFLNYHALKCTISNEDALRLIELGIKVI